MLCDTFSCTFRGLPLVSAFGFTIVHLSSVCKTFDDLLYYDLTHSQIFLLNFDVASSSGNGWLCRMLFAGSVSRWFGPAWWQPLAVRLFDTQFAFIIIPYTRIALDIQTIQSDVIHETLYLPSVIRKSSWIHTHLRHVRPATLRPCLPQRWTTQRKMPLYSLLNDANTCTLPHLSAVEKFRFRQSCQRWRNAIEVSDHSYSIIDTRNI